MLVALDGDWGGDGDKDTQQRRYATDGVEPSHSDTSTTTWRMMALAGTVVVAVWSGDAAVVALVVIAAAVICRSWLLALLLVAVAVGGLVRSEQSWASLEPDQLGSYRGWVRMVDDPQPYPSSTRVIVEIEGERFEIWSRGRAQQLRVGEWRGGEWIAMDGERVQLDEERAGRVAWQHVVGEFELEWASDVDAGGPVARASNRVRASIERASSALPGDDASLFRGLVVGDDRDQPREMIDRFRASGLSHLTAVSGQNVSFLLAAAGPMLRRLRPWMRWAVTIALIAWFVALTRYEPSIVRAGAMAGLSTTAFLLGRDRAPVRILAVAVTGLVLIDPLLVRSVGFWLSVGATLGVSAVGPWLAVRFDRIDHTGIFSLPLGVTLGAQIGVMVPAVLVFGRLPLVSIPANLLAVPVAGMVMLYGMPAGLVAGWIPVTAPVLMFPARLGTRWVDTVASLGSRLEPDPPVQFVGWGIVAVAVVVLLVMTRNTADTHGDLPADR
ncbi:MAG: ComEC/Rec2 family competence protein [Ilumatobacter sp.]|uniref:ComEC/Rec2 family competence protein n=1 Tax=Ilumatobacter sp. TaxID=1967498 RepID=UPI003C750A70